MKEGSIDIRFQLQKCDELTARLGLFGRESLISAEAPPERRDTELLAALQLQTGNCDADVSLGWPKGPLIYLGYFRGYLVSFGVDSL